MLVRPLLHQYPFVVEVNQACVDLIMHTIIAILLFLPGSINPAPTVLENGPRLGPVGQDGTTGHCRGTCIDLTRNPSCNGYIRLGWCENGLGCCIEENDILTLTVNQSAVPGALEAATATPQAPLQSLLQAVVSPLPPKLIAAPGVANATGEKTSTTTANPQGTCDGRCFDIKWNPHCNGYIHLGRCLDGLGCCIEADDLGSQANQSEVLNSTSSLATATPQDQVQSLLEAASSPQAPHFIAVPGTANAEKTSTTTANPQGTCDGTCIDIKKNHNCNGYIHLSRCLNGLGCCIEADQPSSMGNSTQALASTTNATGSTSTILSTSESSTTLSTSSQTESPMSETQSVAHSPSHSPPTPVTQSTVSETQFTQASEDLSTVSETEASQTATKSMVSETEASQTVTQSMASETQASQTVTQSMVSEIQSTISETQASQTATQSAISETQASQTVTQSMVSEIQSTISETQASQAASLSTVSETQATQVASQSTVSETMASQAASQSTVTETIASQTASQSIVSETQASQAASLSTVSETQATQVASQSTVSETMASQAASQSTVTETIASQTASQSIVSETQASQAASLSTVSETQATQAASQSTVSETIASQAASQSTVTETIASQAASQSTVSETQASQTVTQPTVSETQSAQAAHSPSPLPLPPSPVASFLVPAQPDVTKPTQSISTSRSSPMTSAPNSCAGTCIDIKGTPSCNGYIHLGRCPNGLGCCMVYSDNDTASLTPVNASGSTALQASVTPPAELQSRLEGGSSPLPHILASPGGAGLATPDGQGSCTGTCMDIKKNQHCNGYIHLGRCANGLGCCIEGDEQEAGNTSATSQASASSAVSTPTGPPSPTPIDVVQATIPGGAKADLLAPSDGICAGRCMDIKINPTCRGYIHLGKCENGLGCCIEGEDDERPIANVTGNAAETTSPSSTVTGPSTSQEASSMIAMPSLVVTPRVMLIAEASSPSDQTSTSAGPASSGLVNTTSSLPSIAQSCPGRCIDIKINPSCNGYIHLARCENGLGCCIEEDSGNQSIAVSGVSTTVTQSAASDTSSQTSSGSASPTESTTTQTSSGSASPTESTSTQTSSGMESSSETSSASASTQTSSGSMNSQQPPSSIQTTAPNVTISSLPAGTAHNMSAQGDPPLREACAGTCIDIKRNPTCNGYIHLGRCDLGFGCCMRK